MAQQHEQMLERRQQLSALMDGEADAPCTAELCAAWRDDVEARQTWHAWHLIGDVLRSDDLAALAQRDASFFATLRARLGAEPVVVAPAPTTSRTPGRAWSAAAAVAAGFAVVIGAMLVLNAPAPPAAAPVLAQQQQEAAPNLAVAAAVPVAAPPSDPQVLVADGTLIRDARLDRYLAAHKPVGRNPALATSSFGALRPADTQGNR